MRSFISAAIVLLCAGAGFSWTTQTANYASPGYPSAYPNDNDTSYTVSVNGATKIRVHFSAFNTESGYDVLIVMDGAGNKIASYSGNRGSFTSVEVAGSVMKLRFLSDGDVNAAGWKIDRIEFEPQAPSTTTVTAVAAASTRSGMGAIPYAGGVTFGCGRRRFDRRGRGAVQ
jgi:hypothetical protein